MVVPPPGGLTTRIVPPTAPTRSSRPRSPVPAAGSAPPPAVVGHLDAQARVGLQRPDRGAPCVGVLGGVRQRLGDDEVDGRLDSPAGSARRGRRRASSGTDDRSARDWSAGRSPPSARIAGWSPAGELAQLVDRGPGVRRRRIELDQRVGIGIGPHPPTKELERDPQRHQPLLRPVVEVPLHPPPFRILGVDEPRPRRLDGIELRPDLRLEPLVLDRQADGRDGRRDEARVVASTGSKAMASAGPRLRVDGQRRARAGHRAAASRARPSRPRSRRGRPPSGRPRATDRPARRATTPGGRRSRAARRVGRPASRSGRAPRRRAGSR